MLVVARLSFLIDTLFFIDLNIKIVGVLSPLPLTGSKLIHSPTGFLNWYTDDYQIFNLTVRVKAISLFAIFFFFLRSEFVSCLFERRLERLKRYMLSRQLKYFFPSVSQKPQKHYVATDL